MTPELILASASPRRKELLAGAGLHPEVIPAHVDESPRGDEDPVLYARRLARDKALAISARDPRWVLAADTVVHRDGQLFEKPLDEADARRMLGALSASWHQVTSACALARAGAIVEEFAVTTRVRFRALAASDIDRYVASGEPLDKAGAYGIQGQGGGLVDLVQGSYTCVVGLPLPEVLDALRARGLVDEEPA